MSYFTDAVKLAEAFNNAVERSFRQGRLSVVEFQLAADPGFQFDTIYYRQERALGDRRNSANIFCLAETYISIAERLNQSEALKQIAPADPGSESVRMHLTRHAPALARLLRRQSEGPG